MARGQDPTLGPGYLCGVVVLDGPRGPLGKQKKTVLAKLLGWKEAWWR